MRLLASHDKLTGISVYNGVGSVERHRHFCEPGAL
jgi:hypothetical protein